MVSNAHKILQNIVSGIPLFILGLGSKLRTADRPPMSSFLQVLNPTTLHTTKRKPGFYEFYGQKSSGSKGKENPWAVISGSGHALRQHAPDRLEAPDVSGQAGRCRPIALQRPSLHRSLRLPVKRAVVGLARCSSRLRNLGLFSSASTCHLEEPTRPLCHGGPLCNYQCSGPLFLTEHAYHICSFSGPLYNHYSFSSLPYIQPTEIEDYFPKNGRSSIP